MGCKSNRGQRSFFTISRERCFLFCSQHSHLVFLPGSNASNLIPASRSEKWKRLREMVLRLILTCISCLSGLSTMGRMKNSSQHEVEVPRPTLSFLSAFGCHVAEGMASALARAHPAVGKWLRALEILLQISPLTVTLFTVPPRLQ